MTFEGWRELYLADPARFHALAKASARGRRGPHPLVDPELDALLGDHWSSIDRAERDRICPRVHAIPRTWSFQPCYQLHLAAARAWDPLPCRLEHRP
jgi:hypothetical protein